MEFKEGMRVQAGPGTMDPGAMGTVISPCDFRCGVVAPNRGEIPVRWDKSYHDATDFSIKPEDIVVRVPLTEVRTREEAEAWVGEEVEINDSVDGWRRVRIDAATGTPSMDFGFSFLMADGYTGWTRTPGGCYWDLREITEEPKAEDTTGGDLVITTGDRYIVTGTGPIFIQDDEHGKCPHCKAARPHEDHAPTCPCAPVHEWSPSQEDIQRVARQKALEAIGKDRYVNPLLLKKIKAIHAHDKKREES